MFNFKKTSSSHVEPASRRRVLAHEPIEALGEAFRRNRTLTGSLSSSVKSSNELNAELKSSRVQAHDLRRHRRRLSSVLFAVILLGSGLFFLVYNFTATPKTHIESILSLTPATQYEKAIQSYYGSRPVERLNVLLDRHVLVHYVQSKYPEISNVTLTGTAGLGSSSFSLAMRRPLVAWTIDGKKQYVDNDGVVFTKNYFKEPAIEVADESGAFNREGKAIVSNRFLAFIGQSVGGFKQQGFIVEHVIIPSGTTREVQVRVAGFDFPIKLSVDRGIREQAEDAARVLRHLKLAPQTIQYLDVRVSGRAFYQ